MGSAAAGFGTALLAGSLRHAGLLAGGTSMAAHHAAKPGHGDQRGPASGEPGAGGSARSARCSTGCRPADRDSIRILLNLCAR